MKNNFLSILIQLLNISIITLSIFSQKTSSKDQNSLPCEPKICGNQTIKYPFKIKGEQNSSCGYPGFNISCLENTPILQVPDNNFQIQQILYNNMTIHLLDTAILNLRKGCFPKINNISLDPYRFELSPSVSNLYLFSKCSTYPKNLSDYKVGCGGDYGYALFKGNENLSYVMKICKVFVLAKVEVENSDYFEALKGGFTASWIASDCSDCEKSGGRCGFDEEAHRFQCFCSDRIHKVRCNKQGGKSRKVIIAVVISGCVLLTLVMAIVVFCYRKKWKDAFTRLASKKTSSNPSSKSDLEGGGFFLGVLVFSYAELEEATDDFDPSRELGSGGFGSVYHGNLQDGREVAVKRLYEHNYKRLAQFRNEVEILTRLRHKNLVTLYGCTSGQSRELLLVYEYVPNGTVADHLHGDQAKTEPLTWPVRINIAIETASALAYLHKSDIIHRDVKTNNILLDDNFVVKVADFGLSRLFPTDVTHVSTAPQGTPGYVDPEYHQCYQLTEKSDVYSFGVVLVELISSMPAVDINRHRSEINLANLAMNKIQNKALDELIDPALGCEWDTEIYRMISSVAEVAFRCLQLEKEMRPSMDEIFETLIEIRNYKNKDTKTRPCSPEEDHVVLLKTNIEPASPVSVVGKWFSASDSTSSGKSVLPDTQ